tara:strand:+ start:577 stop:1098 length:522 start_codon:yes stop_codon:yes gene_type:complete
MQINFSRCFSWLLAHEGGFSNHARDPGNATMHGVTKATYEDYIGRSVSIDEIKDLTQDDVEPIYRSRYWNRVQGDSLPSGIDWMVFDWAVNSGPKRASQALQKAVGSRADGVIGPKTLDAVARREDFLTIEKIHAERDAFYRSLSTFDVFGRGWLRRNNETLEQAQSLLSTAQ